MNETYLVYIDESYDTSSFVYSAGLVSIQEWNDCFQKILDWRRDLFQNNHIPFEYELHATNFVNGRGEPMSRREKDFRAELYNEFFQKMENIQTIKFLNCMSFHKKNRHDLFIKLLMGIQNFLADRKAYGVLICDEGDEKKLTASVRSLRRSHMSIANIIEDPLFKNSNASYFIQVVDMVAYGVLRHYRPWPNSTHPLVQGAFKNLNQVLIGRKDPTEG